jgi:hypothetical protein
MLIRRCARLVPLRKTVKAKGRFAGVGSILQRVEIALSLSGVVAVSVWHTWGQHGNNLASSVDFVEVAAAPLHVAST